MGRKSKELDVGERAPDFELEDAASGERVALEKYLGAPFMVVFFRGTW